MIKNVHHKFFLKLCEELKMLLLKWPLPLHPSIPSIVSVLPLPLQLSPPSLKPQLICSCNWYCIANWACNYVYPRRLTKVSLLVCKMITRVKLFLFTVLICRDNSARSSASFINVCFCCQIALLKLIFCFSLFLFWFDLDCWRCLYTPSEKRACRYTGIS